LTRNLRDFAKDGLQTGNPLLSTLWRVASIQGHYNPFHPDLMAMNMAQLYFILEMYALDNPKEYTFTRHGKAEESEVLAAWKGVLKDNALADAGGAMLTITDMIAKHAVRKAAKAAKQPRLGIVRRQNNGGQPDDKLQGQPSTPFDGSRR